MTIPFMKFAVSVLLVCGFTAWATAQPHTVDSRADSLRSLRMQIEQLYSVLEKVDRNDFNFTHMRAWWINDPELEDTLRWVYTRTTQDSTLLGGEIEGKAPFYVIATPPPHNDVVALYSGKNILKGKQLRALLEVKPGRDLYNRVVASWGFGQEIELIDKDFTIRNRYILAQESKQDSTHLLFTRYLIDGINHDSATVVSLRLVDVANLRFGNWWGAEVRLGDDALGYPFWKSGNLSFLLIYRRTKVGAHVPFPGGRTPGGLVADLWTPRRLDGTYGLTGEFDFINLGGTFIFGLRRTDVNGTYVNPDSITTIRNLSQLWYSNFFGSKGSNHVLRYKVGVGVHQVGHDQVRKDVSGAPTGTVTTKTPTTYFSPYVTLEYINQQTSERFGVSVQYYSQWVSGGAWLEIIPNHVRLQVKAGAPVFRKRRYWESTHFLMLSIPIAFRI